MSRLVTFYKSTIGKKIVMAVSGFIGFGYVVLHMLGNLQAYEGRAKLNAYAAFLKANMPVLWAARTILIAAFVMHIVAASQLAKTSVQSRPVGYSKWRAVASNIASRTMRWTGPLLGLFIIYHLLHMTTGTLHPSFHETDVYRNVVTGFRVWYISALYFIAMLALGLHLFHGIWSMFQTVGIHRPKHDDPIRSFATIATILIVAGFIAVPLGVLLGIIS